MSLRTVDLVHLWIALLVLLAAAHAGGRLFGRLRQPPVIGEIAGGLVLGPTLLGHAYPAGEHWLFPTTGATAGTLGAFYHFGLLMLVYFTGTDLRGHSMRPQRRVVASIAATGLAVPFAFGVTIAVLTGTGSLAGPTGSAGALALVFGMAVAVTSVPVIARIMMDLGLMGSVFARVVLAVAVVEDVVLYVILAVVLGVSQASAADGYGLWAATGVDSVGLAVVYFSVVPVAFAGLCLWRGGRLLALRPPWATLAPAGPTARALMAVFALCTVCMALGIDPIFGALVAGLASGGGPAGEAAGDGRAAGEAQETLRGFSFAFLVPVYFALVGLRLDLVHNVDVVFFLWFLPLACAVKSASVWWGARRAGESRTSATDLAMAMNARGGPGIVLASVTFAAGVISEEFFTALVLLSILTSQLAGAWLGRAVVRARLLAPFGSAPPSPRRGGDGPVARVPSGSVAGRAS